MAEAAMRLTGITVVLSLCSMLVSCGGGSPGTINGNWSGTLSGTITGTGTAEVFNITVTLNQTSPPDVDVTNLNIANSCVSAPSAISSTFSNGVFNLGVVAFAAPFQNGINLGGKIDGNTITGTWTSTGGASNEGCTASGTFKMTRS
jgi:hypothetical protein